MRRVLHVGTGYADHRQVVEGIVFRYPTEVVSSRTTRSATYGSRGDVEPMAGLAVQLRTLGAEVRVCAPPDCPELLARVGVPLVSIGAWR